MGMSLTVNGSGKTICLDTISIEEARINISALEDSMAKTNKNSCTMTIKGLLRLENSSIAPELYAWAESYGKGKDGCMNVSLVQNYAEIFSRTTTFPEAQLISFKEVFITDNSKYMGIELVIRQKESKSDMVSVRLA